MFRGGGGGGYVEGACISVASLLPAEGWLHKPKINKTAQAVSHTGPLTEPHFLFMVQASPSCGRGEE